MFCYKNPGAGSPALLAAGLGLGPLLCSPPSGPEYQGPGPNAVRSPPAFYIGELKVAADLEQVYDCDWKADEQPGLEPHRCDMFLDIGNKTKQTATHTSTA